jgi:hypothetical protein
MKVLLAMLFIPFFIMAQNRNSIWCFGDSAGIDFSNINNPVAISTTVDGRGSCVSISDSTGQLQWYAYTNTANPTNSTIIRSKNDSVMQNGTMIAGEGWYRELVALPYPGSDSLYYLFSISVTATGLQGLFYSIIDIRQNNGLGIVIQKNVQLLNFILCDGLQAIKHGNGRDWWVVCRSWSTLNNDYFFFLITPQGVLGPYIQSFGTLTQNGFTNINFSKSGNKVAIINYEDLIEIYDFDRCSGTFSNQRTLNSPTGFPPYYHVWNCEFSPNEQVLYIAANSLISYLYHLNLQDSDPWNSRDTLLVQNSIEYACGQLKLAPDGRIYLTSIWNDGINSGYPYPDSAYYTENMNLSVINYPDSLSYACDFQPYSFYLGGKRTYWGLPNNPDYDMNALGGSTCDTLGLPNQVPVLEQNSSLLNIFYHSNWKMAFINGSYLQDTKYFLSVYELSGKLMFSAHGKIVSGLFTYDLECKGYPSGIYFVTIQTERDRLVKRFIIN